MKKKIRIGFLAKEKEIESWSYQMVEKIINIENISPIILFFENSKEIENSLYKFYNKIEQKVFKFTPNAIEKKNVIKILDSILVFNKAISQNKKQRLVESDLDVIINLDNQEPKKEISKYAKCGVWSLKHSDQKKIRGLSNGFWEVINNIPETGLTLEMMLWDNTEPLILSTSSSMTDPNSAERNNNFNLLKSISFIPRKLKVLSELGIEQFLEKTKEENIDPFIYSNETFNSPSNLRMLSILPKHFLKFLYYSKFLPIIKNEQWLLLYSFNSNGRFASDINQYKKILPPSDRFWADPQICIKNNKYFVFIEELIYSKIKAHISVFTIDEDGNYSEPQMVLEEPYHLSFPFIFEYENIFYMIPETSGANNIRLYKSTDFPLKWKFVQNLIENVEAVDTNVTYYNNKWWLFTNIKENEGATIHDELFLFSSDNLFTDNWIPHPQNPIISDVKIARPAGKIFNYNGNLYRPSQNCSVRYGYGFNLNKIIKLNETEYEEVLVNSIEPNWDKKIIGTHTFNFEKDLTVIDALTMRNKFL